MYCYRCLCPHCYLIFLLNYLLSHCCKVNYFWCLTRAVQCVTEMQIVTIAGLWYKWYWIHKLSKFIEQTTSTSFSSRRCNNFGNILAMVQLPMNQLFYAVLTFLKLAISWSALLCKFAFDLSGWTTLYGVVSSVETQANCEPRVSISGLYSQRRYFAMSSFC